MEIIIKAASNPRIVIGRLWVKFFLLHYEDIKNVIIYIYNSIHIHCKRFCSHFQYIRGTNVNKIINNINWDRIYPFLIIRHSCVYSSFAHALSGLDRRSVRQSKPPAAKECTRFLRSLKLWVAMSEKNYKHDLLMIH